NVERNLRAIYGPVVGKADFDRYVDEFVVVRMDIEGHGRGEKSGRVEIEIDLRQMREGVWGEGKGRGLLRDKDMLHFLLGIKRFGAHVGGDGYRTRDQTRNRRHRRKPG